MDWEQKIKELLKLGKEYLAKNDLQGFYDFAFHEALTNEIFDIHDTDDAEQLSEECTEVFYANGVDPVKYLTRIPRGLFYQDVNKSLIDGRTLKFPSNIKEIDDHAFEAIDGFDMVDLRGIQSVGEYAFAYLGGLCVIHFDYGTKFGHNAFVHSNLHFGKMIIEIDGKVPDNFLRTLPDFLEDELGIESDRAAVILNGEKVL